MVRRWQVDAETEHRKQLLKTVATGTAEAEDRKPPSEILELMTGSHCEIRTLKVEVGWGDAELKLGTRCSRPGASNPKPCTASVSSGSNQTTHIYFKWKHGFEHATYTEFGFKWKHGL